MRVRPALLGASLVLLPHAGRCDGPTPVQMQSLLAAGPSASAAAMASQALSLANGALQAKGGDGSQSVATAGSAGLALPGAIPRALGNRFGSVIDERDFGAVCDGTTDDTAAFQAAQLTAQARGGATIQLSGSGTCKLQTVYTVSNNGWEFGADVKLAGTVSGVLDDVSQDRHTIAFQSVNDSNESNLFLSQDDEPSPSAASYQKNGVYVRLYQTDASTYNGTIGNVDQVGPAKDGVGYEAQVQIRAGNNAGRIYGYHSQAGTDDGADGNINVAEFELSNNGTYTPQAGRFNSKRVLHATCIGTVDCTEGIELDGSAHFHVAISAFQNSIRSDGYFLYLGTTSSADLTAPPVFGVSQSGLISSSGGGAITGGFATDRLTVTGAILKPAQSGVAAVVITTPATGAAPNSATQLATAVVRVVSCTSGSALQLPAGAAAGSSVEIMLLNRSGATCTIYPPAGGTIENNAANVAVTISNGTDQAFRSLGPGSWFE